ncbi:MAG: hypothetical protein QOE45_1222 [Frankiaceae bacterium]|nr:hypothetical protein [Frankiaceae bacterium]
MPRATRTVRPLSCSVNVTSPALGADVVARGALVVGGWVAARVAGGVVPAGAVVAGAADGVGLGVALAGTGGVGVGDCVGRAWRAPLLQPAARRSSATAYVLRFTLSSLAARARAPAG